MRINLLVAAGENNAIGKDGNLLWHLPNDLKYFKGLTWGMPVVMGRKTFESVNKPFTGRFNIVLTNQREWIHENVMTAHSFEEAIRHAEITDAKELFVIGGGELYRQTIAMASVIYLTRVHVSLEADTFFPEIDAALWKLKSSVPMTADAKHAFDYTFEVWERRD
jgi:dihydrofolate reductase